MGGEVGFDDGAMAIVRRAYAKQILAAAGILDDRPLERAFASVRREAFLGPPPWHLRRLFGQRGTLAASEPVLVYQDVLFALAPERGVNNGQPSLHAHWLHHLHLMPGHRVAHIGAGTGYYTAILAELVGPDGHVTAVEFDPALAALATRALADRPNVRVVRGDGFAWPRVAVDVVYVNFSVERPAATWIERLAPGGRLMFPLGVPKASPSPGGGTHARHGAGLLVTRVSDGFAACSLGPAYLVCAEGKAGVTAADRAALTAAFTGAGIDFVRSLRWKVPADPGRSWFVGRGWSLGYDEPA